MDLENKITTLWAPKQKHSNRRRDPFPRPFKLSRKTRPWEASAGGGDLLHAHEHEELSSSSGCSVGELFDCLVSPFVSTWDSLRIRHVILLETTSVGSTCGAIRRRCPQTHSSTPSVDPAWGSKFCSWIGCEEVNEGASLVRFCREFAAAILLGSSLMWELWEFVGRIVLWGGQGSWLGDYRNVLRRDCVTHYSRDSFFGVTFEFGSDVRVSWRVWGSTASVQLNSLVWPLLCMSSASFPPPLPLCFYLIMFFLFHL